MVSYHRRIDRLVSVESSIGWYSLNYWRQVSRHLLSPWPHFIQHSCNRHLLTVISQTHCFKYQLDLLRCHLPWLAEQFKLIFDVQFNGSDFLLSLQLISELLVHLFVTFFNAAFKFVLHFFQVCVFLQLDQNFTLILEYDDVMLDKLIETFPLFSQNHHRLV